MSLTERKIRETRPGPKPVILWDGVVKGLGVKVLPTGGKSYLIDYRAGGRQRRMVLARTSELSLKAARERAGAELAAIRLDGADPLERRVERRAAPSVGETFERYLAEHAPRRIADNRLSERTVDDYRKQWKRLIKAAPGFEKLKIAAVTRHDVEKAVASRAPVQRNRTLSMLSMFFNLAEAWELRPQHSNPTRHIERVKEVPRDRVLAPSEIQAIDAVLREGDHLFATACLRFLMLTGWRCSEARTLRWDFVNFETGEITLPKTKTGRDVRTVAALALQALADLPRVSGHDFVFAGQKGRPIGYTILRKTFAAACSKAGIDDARIHDMRRTVATTASAAGLSTFLLRDLLGHKTTAMADRYARRASSALQQAQDDAAARMQAMMRGETAEVVPLRQTR